MEEGEEGIQKPQKQPWKVLEFYSGIGGMRYSITKACVNAKIIEAFEINDIANDVYHFNFGHRPYQGNIQNLTATDLDGYGAHAWLLSPPCQPYTRQGLRKDSGDARASSFLRILELIQHTLHPPLMIFVENVVGFEVSDTHKQMIEILAKTNFTTQEFILTPIQFGVPYSRPRYFCLAKRKPLFFQKQCFNKQLVLNPSSLFGPDETSATNELDPTADNWDELLQSCEPVEKFLDPNNSSYGGEKAFEFSQTISTEKVGGIESDDSSLNKYIVPLSLVERWGSAMDIVYPDSKRCCCFTKSYYRYVKGTGSLLATVQPPKKGKVTPLEEQRLRYFTPREVANLHSFPDDFHFPEHISLRQRYALLGNSLSVAVVAPLLRYLFDEPN